jgi:SAM-dependent methyltransferase
VTGRPLYHEFAWAYDQLVTRPGGPVAGRVARAFAERGLDNGASIVDAGCGTGDYTIALNRAGFAAIGIDASPELLDVARGKAAAEEGGARFEVADLRSWRPDAPVDGSLCRGVLNDFVEDADRHEALAALRAMLRPGGLLIADVRPWAETVAHYSEQRGEARLMSTERSDLVMGHEATLVPDDRAVRFHEWIAMGDRVAECEFVMRCWTPDELADGLRDTGFDAVEVPALDDYLTPRRPDRIVAVARAG